MLFFHLKVPSRLEDTLLPLLHLLTPDDLGNSYLFQIAKKNARIWRFGQKRALEWKPRELAGQHFASAWKEQKSQ